MEFMELIKRRYTVRKYKDTPVELEKRNLVLEAGRLAPTAVNYQPQRIIVLDQLETLNKARQFSTFGFDEKYARVASECANEREQINTYFYNSPVALLVCYDDTACWRHPETGKASDEVDATIVTVHMMLAAASLGLGTAWTSYFDTAMAKSRLRLPDRIQPDVMLLLGYVADYSWPNASLHPNRFPLEKTVSYNQYPGERNGHVQL